MSQTKRLGETLAVFGDSFSAPLNDNKHKLFKTRDSYIKLLSRHFDKTETFAKSGTGPEWSEELLYRTTEDFKKQNKTDVHAIFALSSMDRLWLPLHRDKPDGSQNHWTNVQYNTKKKSYYIERPTDRNPYTNLGQQELGWYFGYRYVRTEEAENQRQLRFILQSIKNCLHSNVYKKFTLLFCFDNEFNQYLNSPFYNDDFKKMFSEQELSRQFTVFPSSLYSGSSIDYIPPTTLAAKHRWNIQYNETGKDWYGDPRENHLNEINHKILYKWILNYFEDKETDKKIKWKGNPEQLKEWEKIFQHLDRLYNHLNTG